MVAEPLSPETSFHLPWSHDEKIHWTLADKSTRRHARRRPALSTAQRLCSQRWPCRHVSRRRGVSRLTVGFRQWKLSFPSAVAFAKQLRVAHRTVTVTGTGRLWAGFRRALMISTGNAAPAEV